MTSTSVNAPSVVAPPPPPPPPCAGNAVQATPFHVNTSLTFFELIVIGPPNAVILPVKFGAVISPFAVIVPVIVPPVAPLIVSTVSD